MEWRNKTKCFYGIVIYHWRVREGLPFSIYSAIFSENCKIDQNSNLTPVKVLAAHSCKTKNWWSSTLTFPKITFLHGGDWLMSVIRNRLHVAMGVISHRWQKTSKCDKTSVTHSVVPYMTFLVSATFWHHLLPISEEKIKKILKYDMTCHIQLHCYLVWANIAKILS